MADPLSVTWLALAVVSLGLQVTGGITDYFDSLKSRDQDIASVVQRNDTLRKTLRLIESSISRFQNDHRTATETLRQFLHSSSEELKVLESMLGLQSSEKLATLQATSQTISSDILVVQSEVSAVRSPIRGIQSTVSQFETHFNSVENLLQQLLVQGSTINGTLQEITPAMVTGRLLGKPAVLQEMCDAVGTRAQHKSKRNIPATPDNAAQIRRTVTRCTGGRFSCLCHHRRYLQHKKAAWGPLRFSHETTIKQHAPGCPATEAITEIDKSDKFALTYAGLRSLLNSAVQLSFSMLELLIRSHYSLNSGRKVNDCIVVPVWQDESLPSVVSSMLDLFRAKKASPQAVDEHNSSLVHFVACFYLLTNKAPANYHNA
ncbi:hypothetical protein DER46DRAFT_630165 [Fusarium sp. MPI-SDFR-AT-0072]|nr:hypothetical protein DER46DRAFT_630165 [Fusarium sp. MPI-SDFR-AT-0072]